MELLVEEIMRLRKVLHNCPEVSMKEDMTREILKRYLREHTDLKVVDCGSWFYAVYEAEGVQENKKAKAIAFRADMDAVSGKDGKPGHYCGHDGHGAVLAGLGKLLSGKRLKRDVYLIFQPAEETGEGAMLCKSLLKEKGIAEIYGFHNIPGYKTGNVLLKKGTFACASTGMEIKVCGTPSHAAYPEYGKNPAFVLAKLVSELPELLKRPHKGILLATVIGMEAGSDSYGVSASEGILRLTVRGEYEEEFNWLTDRISSDAYAYAQKEGMECHIREIQRFPATENDTDSVRKVELAAEKEGLTTVYLEDPMRWSEDFGYYLRDTAGAFFGVGDGEEYPQLHTELFEFPDGIIPAVLKLYMELCEM